MGDNLAPPRTRLAWKGLPVACIGAIRCLLSCVLGLFCGCLGIELPAAPGELDVSKSWIQEIGRYKAEEARQGVAVDARHIYVIDNREIGKYERTTLTRVARWSSPE